MKTRNFKVQPLLGIDERVPQDPMACTEIVNFTVDDNGAWSSCIGYEKFFPAKTTYEPFELYPAFDSLYVWSTHSGARTYYLCESNGSLFFVKGNPAAVEVLTALRTVPAANEMASDHSEMGRWLIVVNGLDQPLKLGEEGKKRTLGWWQAPSPPAPWGVDVVPAIVDAGSTMVVADDDDVGLGSTTTGAINRYRWKMTYVNEDGSESPISEASAEVIWTTQDSATYAYTGNKRMVVLVDGISQGPPGTVACRLYRTKNLGDSDGDEYADELFYYAGQIPNNTDDRCWDNVPDVQLGSEAPLDSDSIVFPCSSVFTAAVFKNRLFTIGRSDPTRVYYSVAGYADTHRALDSFDMGARAGGDGVKLFAHYDLLFVLRERAVEVIYDRGNGPEIAPLEGNIGTKAGHAVAGVPGVGVLFLSYDGVYVIQGGMEGGARLEVKKITTGLQKTLDKLNTSTMAKAWAEYSHKWREWHCYFPSSGSDICNLGVVFHLRNLQWSTREDFPVGCLAADLKGDLIFGHNYGYEAATNTWETGLFVISRRRSLGETATAAWPDIALVDADPPTSRIKSAWIDFGVSLMKQIPYVDLHLMTRGDNTITVTQYKDWGFDGVDGPARRLQRAWNPDHPVYGKTKWNAVDTYWEEPMLADIRFSQQHGSDGMRFCWEVETDEDLVVMGYSAQAAIGRSPIPEGKP